MKKALISVSDKTNIVSFAKSLIELDYEIISTGNTYKILVESGLKVESVESYTGFPEMLGGRVKTLNPKIHAGILAQAGQENELAAQDYEFIDLVCVNLYPFKETLKSTSDRDTLVENIDIGGPTMLRAAAKNFNRVTVVVDNNDFDAIIEEIKVNGETSKTTRQTLASKVFQHTASYDALIFKTLNSWNETPLTNQYIQSYDLKETLRYGENPHQKAWVYQDETNQDASLLSCVQLHGKALSYNNYNDAQAALDIVSEFDAPCVVAVKHMNPCGVSLGKNIDEAFDKTYAADPVSIFGGIVACNGEVTKETATKLNDIFLEIVLATSFSDEALDVLKQKKNLRLLTYIPLTKENKTQMTSYLPGGLLVQEVDSFENPNTWTLSNGHMDDAMKEDMIFAQKIVKHVKSNAIVLAKDLQTVGLGAGQMNRVGAALIACEQAGEKAKGSVLASDAFFPMRDTVDLVAKYGVKGIVQPGGSIKDNESIEACKEHDITMTLTHRRHFKH
ncbi:MAG: bifunctional phosphoribosylaminoimidazolecarboxamide formyltransferase/IMP cyclohydrolase [Erysipelothrix sp.]|nr:bifunctional phosphoribosylaminoimidazolecarboxamide formyltransferase/IMP cyclohydrolase [Erysipelothrix sp.]